MKILLSRTITYYSNVYPEASNALSVWYDEFELTDFTNFNELKLVYRSASIIGNHRVVFNIKGNAYRLIVLLNFKQGVCYIIWFGTHKLYDLINAELIPFDTRIIN